MEGIFSRKRKEIRKEMKKTNLHKRLLSFMLVLLLVFTAVPVNAGAQEVEIKEPVVGGSIDVSNLTFTDMKPEDIKGYVTISFTDKGIRSEEENMEDIYRTPLGEFIKEAKVPFAEGENIPDVTLRLLNALNIECGYSGTAEEGFYMQSLNDMTVGEVYYASLGEFDAGSQSGWMVTYNNWFMDQGASAFTVENGDVIDWLYSCQWGSDIGNNWMNASAEITGIDFKEDGVLTPEFDTEVADYTYVMDEFAGNIAIEILLDNYSSVVSCTLDGEAFTYRPMQDIPVENGSKIQIVSTYPYAENETDEITILVGTKKYLEADVYAAEVYTATGNYLENLSKTTVPTVSSTGGDWMVLGLARGEKEIPEGYYTNVVNYVRANINDAEQLHRAKSTENSRVILALTAAGYDVTNVDGHNLLKGLSDMTYLKKQGINGPVWALLALDAHDYANPSDTVTRELLIDEILKAQLTDGGWSISGKAADADMTGMALQALAPYYSADEKVKAAVDKAVETLSAMQLNDGGYAAEGSNEASCESCAQVVTALTALGIHPDTDERFIKDGKSVLDALLGFAVAEGGFKHSLSGNVDGMATEQGYYALVAYQRFIEEKSALYAMGDVTIRAENPKVEAVPEETPGGSDTETKDNTITENPTQNPVQNPAQNPTEQQPENNEDIAINKGEIYTVKGNKYKVTGKSAVSFAGISSNKTKKVTIPKSVKIKGKSFKVTAITDKALKGRKKVTTVIIGANVKSIGKEAFRNCKKLSRITIKSTQLKKVGKNAFKGIKSNAKIKVPAKKLSAYKKLLKNKGQGKKVKIRK